MRTHLEWDKKLQTFFKDQEIENAYQKLKPLLDNLHEEFITKSLISQKAKGINFSYYLDDYRRKNDLSKREADLRRKIGETYIEAADDWKQKYSQYEWKKGSNIANGADILTSPDMLLLIRDLNSGNGEIKKVVDKTFKGFFTYLSGFNQNRDNYYTTKEEKATAVATRIVHENLPKFCDNLIQFEYVVKKKKDGTEEKIERKSEYLNAYQYVKNQGKITQIKDVASGKMTELFPITENVLRIAYFSSCLSQGGIEKYNQVIGQHNLLINLYNQAKGKEDKTFKRLPQFKTLWKQVGCGKKEPLFFKLTHDTKTQAQGNKENYQKPYSVEQILVLAKKAGEKYFRRKNDDENTVSAFLDYILDKEKDNYEGLYWSKAAMNTISDKYFANYHDLKDRLEQAKVFKKSAKGNEEDVTIPETIELSRLFNTLNQSEDWQKEGVFFKESLSKGLPKTKDSEENKKRQKRREIIIQSKNPSEALLKMILGDIEANGKHFLDSTDTVMGLTEYKSKGSKEKIKQWLDYALAVNRMLKYFLVKESKVKGTPLDSIVSNALKSLLYADDAEWFVWYDALRNYLTKKPQDDAKENKLKLNFQNSTLAGGWDVNKEPDNYCVILQDVKDKQYLAVIAKQEKQKGYNKIFEKSPDNPLYKIDKGEAWQKMEYKQIAAPTGIGGFVRKCFNTAQQYGWKCPDDCLNSEGKIIIKNDEAKANLETIINCYRDFFNKYEKDGYKYKNFNFNFNESGEYEELNDFFGDVEKQGYKLNFTKINKSILNQWVEVGKVYLFEIKNQDSNEGKKADHKNNLHTMYWKALFEDIENKPKLNGGAEIFYRKALQIDKLEKIKDKQGKEIIKNYRFSKEKFLFHCPIRLNYKAKSYSEPKYALPEINKQINNVLTASDNIHFLGIDRGEKHLAYYSLIDRDGNIKKQGTLNLPFTDKDGNPRSIKKYKYFYNKQKDEWEKREVECWDYNDLLDAMASNRDMSRKNWQTIGTIKELKEGYISQVIRKIVDIAVKNNALIVLEDLNTGFKRGRQKIEKSVYQKFELALAKKLNFLVDKCANNGEMGSVTQALQLTPPVNNYGDIENRKQVGIMFYTRANYTSQTDPATGWRKTIYLKKGSEENIKEQILKEFADFGFDGKDYYFDYVAKETKKQWRLYSGKNGKNLDRFRGKRGDKNEWEIERINVVEMLNGLFKQFDINRSFHAQIADEKVELTKIDVQHTAWESLRFGVDVVQQIRNTGKNKKDNDFILSPVRENGRHFDSRFASEGQANSGDANGAYNIARKGIIMHEHIKNGCKLFISDDEWDFWLSGKAQWETWFAKNKDLLSNKKIITI